MSDDLEFDPLLEDEIDPLNPRAKKESSLGDDDSDDDFPIDDLEGDLPPFGFGDDEESF